MSLGQRQLSNSARGPQRCGASPMANSMSGLRSSRSVPTLYGRCLTAVAHHPPSTIRELPDTTLFDVYDTMYKERRELLIPELSDLDRFYRVLKGIHTRLPLIRYFQSMIEMNINLPRMLSAAYAKKCSENLVNKSETVDLLIDLGIRLGAFLNDVAWYSEAETVLLACKNLCADANYPENVKLTLECCHRLLHAQSLFRNFKGAKETYNFAGEMLHLAFNHSHLSSLGIKHKSKMMDDVDLFDGTKDLRISFDIDSGPADKSHSCKDCVGESNNLLIRLFKEFAVYHFLRSDYNDTFKWSMRALELIKPDTPVKIVIEVLCMSGKACVMMRKFAWAKLLIQQGVARARSHHGYINPKYAFALLDYGFYFLNVDHILKSVIVYEEALGVLSRVYNGNNLHVAIAHEDLSYALYVHEYSSGRFYKAREHVNKAIKIMEVLLPAGHLMLATTKRVKALILEEIALDTPPFENPSGNSCTDLLEESEKLHRSALELSLSAFGEMNVQTAKQYGNLGRLYQSMRKFTEAEAMQLRAIKIKEQLLGPSDFEVGLSLGHLASLYNYHMKQFPAAEDLYYRSISINLKLFGEDYSGLEYDYIGLIHVNTELKRPDRVAFYNQLLLQWREKRDIAAEQHHSVFGKEAVQPIIDVQSEIFNFDDNPWKLLLRNANPELFIN